MFRADVSRAWLGVPDAGSSGTLSLREQVQQHPVLCCGMWCSACVLQQFILEVVTLGQLKMKIQT